MDGCFWILSILAIGSSVVQGALQSRIKHHKWEVDYLMWSPDCVEDILIAINGQYPGPTIRARAGDTIVVELHNKLETEGVTIHWHGIRQIGTPWADGTTAVQCAINPREVYTYRFVVDKAGTYFYHGHYGMQRSAGLYGSLIVDVAKGEEEPFSYDGEVSMLLNDWWHEDVYKQMAGLSSKRFRWINEPQSLLIGGRGQYNCSLSLIEGKGNVCNTSNPQCAPYIIPVEAGKTYRLRIANVAALSALNFLIEGHKMMLVEADGNYIEPLEVSNMDIYSGETYSVLVKTDQDPSKNYWAAIHVRGREPKTHPGVAILNYQPLPPSKPASMSPPPGPVWNDYAYSRSFAGKIVAKNGHGLPVPVKSDRTIVLLNTQNLVEGYIKWAINNVSLSLPATPYLASLKYRLKKTFNTHPAPDNYSATYNIMEPPSNPNAVVGNSIYSLEFNTTVDVVLQNANTLTANNSEIHPWHLHGHDFWVLGYGEGKFDPATDSGKFNLKNPPLKNTVPLFPYGWTALRFVADNPGVWMFHCHVEPHLHMGMGVVFAEGVERVGNLPRSSMGCGATRRWLP